MHLTTTKVTRSPAEVTALGPCPQLPAQWRWADGGSSPLVLNVGNGWEWGLLGWLLIVSQWIIPENALLSTSKFRKLPLMNININIYIDVWNRITNQEYHGIYPVPSCSLLHSHGNHGPFSSMIYLSYCFLSFFLFLEIAPRRTPKKTSRTPKKHKHIF